MDRGGDPSGLHIEQEFMRYGVRLSNVSDVEFHPFGIAQYPAAGEVVHCPAAGNNREERSYVFLEMQRIVCCGD